MDSGWYLISGATHLVFREEGNRRLTRRYSERNDFSRIMLRAANSAPTHFIAELKCSAKNMKQLRDFLFGIGCIGTIFCLAVGLIGFRHSNPARWSIVLNAEIQKSYVTNRIISRTMPVKWAPVIKASYEFKGKRIIGSTELGSYESKPEAEIALASQIRNWSGHLYIYNPEPSRAALVLHSQDYYIRILLYGIPFFVLLIASLFAMLKKNKSVEPLY